MSDEPIDISPRGDRFRCERQDSSWATVTLAVVSLLAMSCLVVFGMAWLRYANAKEAQSASVRARTNAQIAEWKKRTEAAEARVVELEGILDCRQDLLITLKDAQDRAIRATGDVVRATAETFNNLVIHGQTPPPDPLRPAIDALDAANSDADRALAAYSAACPVPLEQGD